MNVRRGDVVLVAFPFSQGTGHKRRPALVVQSDVNNLRIANTILAAITTTTHRSREATQFLVDPVTPDGQRSGLLMVSVVSCENLATVEQSLVTRIIGHPSQGAMRRVDQSLKVALALA